MLGSMSQPLILYKDCLDLKSSITKHPSVVNSWESYLIFQGLGFFSFCKVELIPDSLECEQDNPESLLTVGQQGLCTQQI